MLVSWSPLGLILVAYAAAKLINQRLADKVEPGSSNLLGLHLHIAEPAVADSWFFGRLPTVWLQDAWYTPTSPHWYDVIVALVYVSHFVAIPIVTTVLWFRHRDRFRDWICCVLLLSFIGIATYVLYPMSPPWLASQLGFTEEVHRISGIGFDYMGLGVIEGVLGGSQAAANPVAAMPSLHAASAALVALFFWSGAVWWVRLVLALYPAVMGISLVYSGEHYVVDVVAGWIAAALAVVGWRLLRRSRSAMFS